MKDTRVSRRLVAAGILAGLLLALGLCNRPISAPEDGPGERTHEGTPGESPDGPGTAGGEEPSEPASDTTDEGSRPAREEPSRTVDLLVRIQDGMTGGPADALAVTARFGHPARSVPLVPVEAGSRLEGGVPRDGGFWLHVTPLPGFAPEAPSLRFGDRIRDEVRTVVATVVVWPTFGIRVEVRDRDGLAAPDVHLEAQWSDGSTLASGCTGLDGAGQLSGIPLVPDEWIVVQAARGGMSTSGVLKPVRPGEARLVRLVLWESFGGARDGSVDEDAAARERWIDEMDDLTEEPPPVELERRAVEVRVRDDAGRPVPSAWVTTLGSLPRETAQHLGLRTDASGRAALPGVPRTETWLRVGRGTREERIVIGPAQDRVDVTLHEGMAPPRPYVRGIVTRVEGEVRISVGRNAGVTPDLAFDVWRLGEDKKEPRCIGTLRVERVEETWASARIVRIPENEGRPPRVGDMVCTDP